MRNQSDTEKLINYCVGFAKYLLESAQEFYPFGAYVNFQEVLTPIGYYDGDEFPLSEVLINKLQTVLNEYLEEKKIRAYALACDVKVKPQVAKDSVDAIAVKIKHDDGGNFIVYYFTYRLSDHQKIEYLESWGEILE